MMARHWGILAEQEEVVLFEIIMVNKSKAMLDLTGLPIASLLNFGPFGMD